MSGRKRRGQEWEREMMERETGVGEIERDRDWTKRERERGYRCGIKRETWNYFITFLATFLFSRCYKL